MAVTNAHLADKIDNFVKNNQRLEDRVHAHDEILRGNGDMGLKARVGAIEKVLLKWQDEFKWIRRTIWGAIIVDIVIRILIENM